VQPLVTSRGTNEFNASWSPSGERVVYQSGPLDGSNFDLYTVGLYETAPTPLLVGPDNVQAAQFCDEDTIVYTQRFDPTSADVYAIEADGTGRRRLTDGLGSESFPTCSPDGTRVAFISNADGSPSIYEVPLLPPPVAGRPFAVPEPVRLTPGVALDPDYSPDGSRLAYIGIDPMDGSLEVFTIGVTGGAGVQRTFTPPPFQNRLPKFSPDALGILHTRRVPVAAAGRAPSGGEEEFEEDLASADTVVVDDASGGSWGSAPRIAC
jgi:TolB protein